MSATTKLVVLALLVLVTALVMSAGRTVVLHSYDCTVYEDGSAICHVPR